MADRSFALDLQFSRSLIIIIIVRDVFNVYNHVCIQHCVYI